MRDIANIISYLIILLIPITEVFPQDNHQLTNHFEENWIPRSYEEPPVWTSQQMVHGNPDASILIDLSDTIAPVLPTQFGVNTPFRNGDGMLTDGIRFPVYERTNLGSFRFPAGSGSNQYFWDGNVPGQFLIDVSSIDGTESGALKPEHFAEFIDSLGSQATVVVNYFYARYGIAGSGTREERVQQAAEYAAGFVNRLNIELKAGIKYWEVGNECYGKWETGYDVNGSIVTGKEYGEDFRVFVSEMKKIDSTIKVGAVLYSQDTEWNPQVIQEVTEHADFFVIHNYFTSEKDATPGNILGSVGQISEIVSLIDQTMSGITTKTLKDIPVALTEFNCRGPCTTNMVDALFVTQILGEIIKCRIGLATMWVSEWKWKVDAEPKSFLAWEDPGQPDYTPYPVYMPFYLYGKCFGDHMMGSQTTGSGVHAYASKFSSGEIGVAIANTNGNPALLNINLINSGNHRIREVDWYEVSAGSIEAGDKKFYINGITGTTPGGGPEEYHKVPPFRIAVEDSCLIQIPSHSISFLILKLQDFTGSYDRNLENQVRIYPNPANDRLHISSVSEILSCQIFNSSGSLVKTGNRPDGFLNLSDLPSGYFILKLESSERLNSLSFIKK